MGAIGRLVRLAWAALPSIRPAQPLWRPRLVWTGQALRPQLASYLPARCAGARAVVRNGVRHGKRRPAPT